jgi:sigma-B regulation protein RsbU (phosphoserine phosphatase)
MKNQIVTPNDLIRDLTIKNLITEKMNHAVDIQGVLNGALSNLLELMGLKTGWISLKEQLGMPLSEDTKFKLAFHHNLPPALNPDNPDAWNRVCACQRLCREGLMTEAYNEIRCSRLASAKGNRQGLSVHASTPLRSGENVFGILNVARQDWESFSPESLTLLTNVGDQIGIALERANLFDMLQEQRIREQTVLLDLSNKLMSHTDSAKMGIFLVEEVSRIMKSDACTLLLSSQEAGFLQVRAVSGFPEDRSLWQQMVPANRSSALGMVMDSQEPLQIEDINISDPINWMIDGSNLVGFRSQVAVPMISEGRSVGVLILNSKSPRKLDEGEIQFLSLMANQAGIVFEQTRLQTERVEQKRLAVELDEGRHVQLSLLPEAPPTVPGWKIASSYQAARQVGGDFYDFFELPEEPGRIGMVIGDVVDKGVPAALLMAVGHTVIRATALSGKGPSKSLERANELILNDSRGVGFLSAFYAELDSHSGRLVFANAGQNPPFWVNTATGVCQQLTTRGSILGIFSGIELEESEINIGVGDLLVFYTDGLTEAVNENGQMFEEERLYQAITAIPEASAEQVLHSVKNSLEAFVGDTPQSDDQTIFVVKRL